MFCLFHFTPFSEIIWKKFTKCTWELKVQSFLNLDAAAGELESNAPPPMNSMLAKHCNNHCSKKYTKTCPSYEKICHIHFKKNVVFPCISFVLQIMQFYLVVTCCLTISLYLSIDLGEVAMLEVIAAERS